jgi:hypothetical protein
MPKNIATRTPVRIDKLFFLLYVPINIPAIRRIRQSRRPDTTQMSCSPKGKAKPEAGKGTRLWHLMGKP